MRRVRRSSSRRVNLRSVIPERDAPFPTPWGDSGRMAGAKAMHAAVSFRDATALAKSGALSSSRRAASRCRRAWPTQEAPCDWIPRLHAPRRAVAPHHCWKTSPLWQHAGLGLPRERGRQGVGRPRRLGREGKSLRAFRRERAALIGRGEPSAQTILFAYLCAEHLWRELLPARRGKPPC